VHLPHMSVGVGLHEATGQSRAQGRGYPRVISLSGGPVRAPGRSEQHGSKSPVEVGDGVASEEPGSLVEDLGDLTVVVTRPPA